MDSIIERQNDFVSVILSVYNGERFLGEAIESILNQTHTNLELIIINDGSTDSSDGIIKKFLEQDSRIILLSHEHNSGLITSLNDGITHAKGHYIARIDSDDIWSDKDKLKEQIDFLKENPKCALVGTNAIIINEVGDTISSLTYPSTDHDIRQSILIKNYFIHSSVCFLKPVAVEANFYNPKEKYVEDYGLWLRIGEHSTFANISKPMVSYRMLQTGETRTHNLHQCINSLKLVYSHRKMYPRFLIALIKWSVRIVQNMLSF